jgi:hypothetical protein
VPHDRLEEIHRIGSHAQCTPAVDGQRVVSFFGSAGLFCHDVDGNLLWKRPMGPFKNTFGAGSSPLLVDDWVVLCQDHDTDSFLTAIDKRDLPAVQGSILFLSLVFVLVNLITDLLYARVDPRVAYD